ncbi:MAG: TonB-dependent receptor [Coleofasciculaceae cyanobacterium]
MKRRQLIPGILLTSSVVVMMATPATAEVVQVTGVRLNRTDGGLEIILETASGISPQAFTTSSENSLIIDVLNAQLDLLDGDEFRQENPTEEIAEISLIQLTPNNIQVVITGTTALPETEVVPDAQGLAISISTASDTAEVVPEPEAPETSETEQEIEIVVTQTQAGERYLVPNSTTGTRTDTPILDVPQSVQVIPRRVLEDQQVIRLDEALRNVSGVTANTDSGRGLEFRIRGFEGVPVLRNGFRQFGGAGQTIPETANLERVEVLKGPASILYGEIQPGGTINLVTKRPLSEPFYEIQAQVGNRNLFRPSIDISGPLTSDGKLLYRLNALYLTSDEVQDFDTDIERFFISPVVTWALGDRTDLTLELEYFNSERPPLIGSIPAFGDGVADIPFDRIIIEPDDIAEEEYFQVGYDLEHRFSDNWKLRNGFRYTNQQGSIETAFPLFGLDEESGIVTRTWAVQPEDSESYSLQTSLIGEFATGSLDHTLLFGADLNRTNDRRRTRLDPDIELPINIFDPVYEAFPRPDFDELPLAIDRGGETDRLGIFLQDQIEFSDNLILLAGLRYDTVEQRREGEETIFSESTDETQNDDSFTPRFGLVFKPTEDISLYASYSRSFAPNSGMSADGDFFEPELGEGFEVGVKSELLDGQLLATLAYFNITKKNIVTEDADNPLFSVATGEQRSQGVELDLVGEISPGWNVILSYAYIDAEVTEDNVIEVGNRLAGIPEHSASLWTTYEIQKGSWQGLGFGLGFNFVGERAGDLENSFEVDSYFTTNAAIFYERNNWRAALNFRNLFDVDYISDVKIDGIPFGERGEPFTIIGSISVKF